MRVIVFGLRGLPDVEGGIESHAENLYPLLVQLGAEIEILTRSPFDPGPSGRTWKGIRLTRLWAPERRSLENIVHSVIAVLYCAIKRPDIVHIHAIGPGLVVPLARLLGLRVVLTHHGFDYEREKWGKVARLALRLGERFGVRFSNRVIAISKTIKNSISDRYHASAELIPNGVSIPTLTKTQDALDKFGLVSHRYVLLVSRMVPEKRHLDLISAFRKSQLAEWKLVLVGKLEDSNDYAQDVKQACAQDPNVVLTGFQSGQALQELFTHAGAFVLPSSHEGLPIALLEALSYGLPVLASNIPANRDVGLTEDRYFDLGNVDCLSNKMQRLALEATSEHHSEVQREWVRGQYNWDNIAGQTLLMYGDKKPFSSC